MLFKLIRGRENLEIVEIENFQDFIDIINREAIS